MFSKTMAVSVIGVMVLAIMLMTGYVFGNLFGGALRAMYVRVHAAEFSDGVSERSLSRADGTPRVWAGNLSR